MTSKPFLLLQTILCVQNTGAGTEKTFLKIVFYLMDILYFTEDGKTAEP